MNLAIQVLRVTVREGISRKSGLPYRMAEAQCVYSAPNPDTGEIEPSVGTLLLPRGQEDARPGNYLAGFTLRTNREGRVEAVIARLSPVAASVEKRSA